MSPTIPGPCLQVYNVHTGYVGLLLFDKLGLYFLNEGSKCQILDEKAFCLIRAHATWCVILHLSLVATWRLCNFFMKC